MQRNRALRSANPTGPRVFPSPASLRPTYQPYILSRSGPSEKRVYLPRNRDRNLIVASSSILRHSSALERHYQGKVKGRGEGLVLKPKLKSSSHPPILSLNLWRDQKFTGITKIYSKNLERRLRQIFPYKALRSISQCPSYSSVLFLW